MFKSQAISTPLSEEFKDHHHSPVLDPKKKNKTFNDHILTKYENMDKKSFDQLPKQFINTINKLHSIDLRTINTSHSNNLILNQRFKNQSSSPFLSISLQSMQTKDHKNKTHQKTNKTISSAINNKTQNFNINQRLISSSLCKTQSKESIKNAYSSEFSSPYGITTMSAGSLKKLNNNSLSQMSFSSLLPKLTKGNNLDNSEKKRKQYLQNIKMTYDLNEENAKVAAAIRSLGETISKKQTSSAQSQRVKAIVGQESTFNNNSRFLKRSNSRLLSQELLVSSSLFGPQVNSSSQSPLSKTRNIDSLSTEKNEQLKSNDEVVTKVEEELDEDIISPKSENLNRDAVQNLSKLMINENNFRFRIDEEKEKLKEEHLQSLNVKQYEHRHILFRRSLKITADMLCQPLKMLSQRQINLQQNDNSPRISPILSQFNTKFILNKPFSPSKHKQAHHKQLIQTSPQNTNNQKISFILASSPSSFKLNESASGSMSPSGSPLTNKSYFATQQYQIIEENEKKNEEIYPIKKVKEIIPLEKTKSFHQKKSKNEQGELKSGQVKHLFEEQIGYFLSYRQSVIVRNLEKNKYDNQIQLKNTNKSSQQNQNQEGNDSPSNKNKLLQQVISFDSVLRTKTPKHIANKEQSPSNKKQQEFRPHSSSIYKRGNQNPKGEESKNKQENQKVKVEEQKSKIVVSNSPLLLPLSPPPSLYKNKSTVEKKQKVPHLQIPQQRPQNNNVTINVSIVKSEKQIQLLNIDQTKKESTKQQAQELCFKQIDDTLKVRRSSFMENQSKDRLNTSKEKVIPEIQIEILNSKTPRDTFLELNSNSCRNSSVFIKKSICQNDRLSFLLPPLQQTNRKEYKNKGSKESSDFSSSSDDEEEQPFLLNGNIKLMQSNSKRDSRNSVNMSSNSRKSSQKSQKSIKSLIFGQDSSSKRQNKSDIKRKSYITSSKTDRLGGFGEVVANIRQSLLIEDNLNSNKKKGIVQVSEELQEIIIPCIEDEINRSSIIKKMCEKFKEITLDQIKFYFSIFLLFCLSEDNQKSLNAIHQSEFFPFKLSFEIFNELQIITTQTLEHLGYNTFAIQSVQESLETQKKNLQEGLLIEEISGPSGVLKIVADCMDELNTKLPYSFAVELKAEERSSILIRLITIVCAQERKYFNNQSQCRNFLPDTKCNYLIQEFSSISNHLRDFTQREFYWLKLVLHQSLTDKKYRSITIYRILEQLEYCRYRIVNQLTIDGFLSDNDLYDQIHSDISWKIQCSPIIFNAFESNSELLSHFIHSLLLQLLYRTQPQFDLVFLVTHLPLIQQSTMVDINKIVTEILQYRQMPSYLIYDLGVAINKIIYKTKLAQCPLNLLGGYTFIPSLISEIDSIMNSDQCFGAFILKFPEDKKNLTLENEGKTKSGLKGLNFFLLSLLSEYNFYSIQDLQSSLQVFDVSITIPIQWKIAIDFSLNNLKVPSNISSLVLGLISEQFSLLYRNTHYESFNSVLLN